MGNIQWKRNEFHTFYATMKIRIGDHSGTNSHELQKGDELEYDGTICKYAGLEFSSPQLRSAINKGWVVPDYDDVESVPTAHVANRTVAKSQVKTTDLSKVQRIQASSMDHDSLDEETVLRVGDRGDAMDNQRRGHLTAQHNRRVASGGLNVTQDEIEEQEYIPIKRIQTSANLGKIDITDPRNSGLANRLNSISSDDGFGRTDQTKKVIVKEGITIISSADMDRSQSVYQEGDDSGVVVGQVRHTDRAIRNPEGISVTDTSGDPLARHAKKTAKKVAKKVAEAASSKSSGPVNTNSNAYKLKVARKIYSDFPEDWNFFGKPADKMQALKKMGAPADMILALHTAESNSMKKLLEKTYPKHFS